MANPPVWKQLEDLSVCVSPLPGMRGVKVFTKLSNMLAKGTAGLAGLSKAKNELEQGVILLGLLSHVEPDDVEYLCTQLLENALVRVNGQQSPLMPVFDQVFQARTHLVFKVLVEALRVNYGTFFKGLIERVASGVQAATPSNSTSPTTSPTVGPAGV
jgi:hypothetical protein